MAGNKKIAEDLFNADATLGLSDSDDLDELLLLGAINKGDLELVKFTYQLIKSEKSNY